MRIRLPNELVVINILTVLLISVITFLSSSALRIILGVPFVLFFPGYILIAAFFPRKNQLDSIERVVLSFGLSIALVPLIGLILNYTPWGIRLYPILISLTIFIVAISIVAWYRRRRLTEVERTVFSFNLSLPSWSGQSSVDKVLSIFLVATILGAIAILGYVVTTAEVGEKFAEFYILGLEGKAIDYRKELKVGEEGRVIVGIINREHDTVRYRVEATIDGARHAETDPVILHHGDKWEQEVGFVLTKSGDNRKVEFLLYKNGQSEPYLKPLHLWVNVKE